METVNSISEILDFAIAREVEAYKLYKFMAVHMSNPEMRQVCDDFAREEQEHRAKLKLMKADDSVANFNLTDYKMQPEVYMDMGYEDLLIFAIKKEDKSINLYRDLAKIVKDEESHKILLFLVKEETEHKERFEAEYIKH